MTAPSDQSMPQRFAGSVRPDSVQWPATIIELQIEGQREAKPLLLPCNLEISQQGASMVLDFHAGRSSAPRIRQQTRQLEFYLNQNRDDARASRAPEGRPDPESFPIRQILGARPIATEEDLPDGARLTLSPANRAHALRLLAEVLWHAGDLLPGLPLTGKTCPELPAELEAAAAVSEDR